MMCNLMYLQVTNDEKKKLFKKRNLAQQLDWWVTLQVLTRIHILCKDQMVLIHQEVFSQLHVKEAANQIL